MIWCIKSSWSSGPISRDNPDLYLSADSKDEAERIARDILRLSEWGQWTLEVSAVLTEEKY
jgi:hypothetical protein